MQGCDSFTLSIPRPSPSNLNLPRSSKQRQLQPFPVAIHFLEPDLAKPLQLNLHTGQLIGTVFVSLCDSEGTQESTVQIGRCRGHMLQIAENATWLQRCVDLGVKRLLALV